MMGIARSKSAVAILGVLALASAAGAHGTVANSRMYNVKLGGPNGNTPAGWNESYYTWSQNSNNFINYAAPGFSYANEVPNGTISSAGINDGVKNFLNFSGLNTPSANWATTPATAGQALPVTWLATAPHDPSYFDVYFTKQGFDITSAPLTWGVLDFLGRWEKGTALPVTNSAQRNPIDGNAINVTYDWTVPIPADRSGRHGMVVVWQRRDSAGEAFFSTSDLMVAPIPEPTALGGLGVLATGLLARRRRSGRVG